MSDADEIASLKARLAALEAPATELKARPEKAKWRGGIIGCVVVGGIILLALSVIQVEDNPTERIEASCRREYGGRGEQAVNSCKIQLMVEELDRREARKADRARSGAQ